MKHLVFKFLLIFFSTLLAYLIVFFYFYINLEKDFKNNIKNKENTGLKAKEILPYTIVIMFVGIIIFSTCLLLF